MADIKVSGLTTATETTPSDLFMIVQSGSNKKITLETLLGNLNTDININSKLQGVNFNINGQNRSNLLYTDAANNKVGILTNVPSEALQVVGNVKIGDQRDVERTITEITVDDTNDSGGTGYKLVTVTTSLSEDIISGIYNIDDVVNISGIKYNNGNPFTAMNGMKKIGQGGTRQFKYKIPNEVVVTDLDTTPAAGKASKTIYRPGVVLNSVENLSHDVDSGVKFISANYAVTGLTIIGDAKFTLASEAKEGQEKVIYLFASESASDDAILENINALGFNRVVLPQVGDSIRLMYLNGVWVLMSKTDGVTISTV